MSHSTPPADPALLLEHASFVRAVARAAAGADDLVDDAVQDTYVAALRSGPREPGKLRSWLGSVARRRTLDLVRREARRRRHESGAPETRGSPSGAELVERMELGQRLCDAVSALPDAQREAILLRYYEGLGTSEIAARLEVPVETVRTRLKRGLAALRQRMDADSGGRKRWAVLLVAPMPRTRGGPRWLVPAAGAVFLAIGAALFAVATGDPPVAPPVSTATNGAESVRPDQPLPDVAAPPAASDPPTESSVAAPELAPLDLSDYEPLLIAGHVTDEDGRPVEGVYVYAHTEADPAPVGWNGSEATTSQEDGSFVLDELPEGAYRLTAVLSPHESGRPRRPYSAVREGVTAGTHDVRLTVPSDVLATSSGEQTIRVIVRGADGTPIPVWGYATRARGEGWIQIDGRAEPGPDEPETIDVPGAPPFQIHVFGASDEDWNDLPFGEAMLRDVAPREEPYEVRLRRVRPGTPATRISGTAAVAGGGPPEEITVWYRLTDDGRAVPPEPGFDGSGPVVQALAEIDEHGRFSLEGLPPGRVYLSRGVFQAPRDRPWLAGREVEVGSGDVHVEFPPAQPMRVTVHAPAESRAGKLRCAVFRRIGGGRVFLEARDGPDFRGETVTLTLPAMPPEWRLDVEFELRDGWDEHSVFGHLADVPGGGTHDVSLAPLPSIRGRVRSADGEPLRDVVVMASPADRPGLGGLLGADPAMYDNRADELEFLESTQPAEAWASGRMRAVGTDEDGAFTISGLWPGTYVLGAIDGHRFAVEPTPVAAGTRGIELVLGPLHQITGRLHGADDPATFVVQAFETDAPDTGRLAAAVGDDGFVALQSLRAASHRLVAWNPTDPRDDRLAMTADVQAGARSLSLHLTQGRGVTGRVLTTDGTPLGHVSLRVRGPFVDRRLRADDAGRFRINGLPPGAIEVIANTIDGRGGRVRVTEGTTETEVRVR